MVVGLLVSARLSIGGVPICGVMGDGERITIVVGECWAAYARWVRQWAGGAPLCVVRNVSWAVNGHVVDTPRSFFLTLEG